MRDALEDSPNVSPADHFTYHQEHKPPWGESSFAQLSFYKNLLLPFNFRLLFSSTQTLLFQLRWDNIIWPATTSTESLG